MFALALRQLRWDLGRSVLTCIGVGAVFAVILLLQGFREGLDTQLRRVALERDADLIATQAGVRNMIGARSVIPQMARALPVRFRGMGRCEVRSARSRRDGSPFPPV